MKCFITGANGFIGRYLVNHLQESGYTVGVFIRNETARGIMQTGGLCVYHGSVLDAVAVSNSIRKFEPDVVFHLAAQSLPGLSWDRPADTFRVNIDGTVNVLEAVRLLESPPKVVMACSSAEYAPSPDGLPIREQAPMRPSSPYAVSKQAASHIARLYGERYGLLVVRMYPFFLIGPGKKGDVCSDLARGIVAIERGQRQVLSVGNLEAVRDFVDVRDGVAACRLLAERGEPGAAYNICSGHGYSIRHVLDVFKRLSSTLIIERNDPARMRPLDESVKVGDATKIEALGWNPVYSLDETLGAILEHWRTTQDIGII